MPIIRLALLLALLAGCSGQPPEPNPVTMTPALSTDGMTTRDGQTHVLYRWLPDAAPQAVVVGLHSFGDYHAAFDHLGPWFARQGIAFYTWDQRGFGAHANAGRWPGDAGLIADATDAVRLLSTAWQVPVFLLGESMGGGVALISAAQDPSLPIAGLILAAPSVREGLRTRYLWNTLLTVGGAFAPGASYTLERDPADPRYTPASAERLATDPQVIHRVRMDTYRDLIRFTDRASRVAGEVQAPILLLFGGQDSMIPPVSIERLREQHPDTLTWRYYPEAPHLLLQSRDWQQAATDIRDWIQQTLTGVGAHSGQQ